MVQLPTTHRIHETLTTVSGPDKGKVETKTHEFKCDEDAKLYRSCWHNKETDGVLLTVTRLETL